MTNKRKAGPNANPFDDLMSLRLDQSTLTRLALRSC